MADFLIAPCNRDAVAWVDRWPEWSAPALILYGSSGSGKSHLAHVWRARSNAALKDLSSRLLACPAIGIGPPDDALIGAVMVKQFTDRQVKIDPEVLTFLLARMERSFAAVSQLVAALDQAALAEKRRITVPLAREVLDALQQK